MDEEYKKRLADYFTSAELVDLLGVPTAELVDLLEDYILDNKEDLDEYLNYGVN